MRSADLTKEACLKLWNKHKDAIEETIKTKSKDCKCTLKFGDKFTNESRLEYVNKMIERINNCDYDK
jgi:hypothetical protein